MNDIVESQLESALSTIIATLLTFVLDHLLLVMLVIVAIAGVIALMTFNSKRKHTAQLLRRAIQLQSETSTRLSQILVTDTFKELELGLAQGETERGLLRMEKAAYGLHKQSEQFGVKLKEYQSNSFAPAQSLYQAEQLTLEAEDLHERVERYLNDLSGIEQSTRITGKHMRQLNDRLVVIIEQIENLGKERNYPLDELRQQLKRVELEFKKIDQLAAFDAIQARPESDKLGRQIDELHLRTQALQKNITIMDQIRTRLQKQEEQLRQRMEQKQLHFEDEAPLQIFRKTDPIMEHLHSALRLGKEVDLRSVATDIELILQQAIDLVDSKS